MYYRVRRLSLSLSTLLSLFLSTTLTTSDPSVERERSKRESEIVIKDSCGTVTRETIIGKSRKSRFQPDVERGEGRRTVLSFSVESLPGLCPPWPIVVPQFPFLRPLSLFRVYHRSAPIRPFRDSVHEEDKRQKPRTSFLLVSSKTHWYHVWVGRFDDLLLAPEIPSAIDSDTKTVKGHIFIRSFKLTLLHHNQSIVSKYILSNSLG